MGVLYEFGMTVSQDFDKAFRCYQESAERGEHWGMHYLSSAYMRGKGTEKNPKKAFQWELKAAENVSGAYLDLGVCYLFGLRVEANRGEAFKWLKRASACGMTKADELIQENWDERMA